MENKIKRGLEFSSAISSIVIGCLGVVYGIWTLVLFIMQLTKKSSASNISSYRGALIGALILSVFILIIAVAFIVLGSILCRKTLKEKGIIVRHKGLDITTIILCISYIVLIEIGYYLVYLVGIALVVSWVNIFYFMTIITLFIKIISYNIESENCSTGNLIKEEKLNLTIEEKIKELKRLKELGVISEEQYGLAIEKAIKEISK